MRNRTALQRRASLLWYICNQGRTQGVERRNKKEYLCLELSAKGQKENKYFSGQTQAKQLYKRILEWIQIRRPLKSEESSSQTINKIEPGEEYLLDSYDRKGQYCQLERKGILEEAWDRKA